MRGRSEREEGEGGGRGRREREEGEGGGRGRRLTTRIGHYAQNCNKAR